MRHSCASNPGIEQVEADRRLRITVPRQYNDDAALHLNIRASQIPERRMLFTYLGVRIPPFTSDIQQVLL